MLRRNIKAMIPRFSSARITTLVAVAFIEVLYLVRYAIFRAKEGLYTLIASDTLLFHQFFNEEDESVV